MSRDIFVQDIPADAQTVAEIPDAWVPSSLPFTRDELIAVVLELAPDADFSDPSWGRVALPGAHIEVNVGDESPLMSFALHMRGDGDVFVASLLDRLHVRAFDPQGAEKSGIFGHG